MPLSDEDHKAALAALRKQLGIADGFSDVHVVLSSGGKWLPWLRAWELATQAAYERAARLCETMSAQFSCSTYENAADQIRALAKGEQP